MTRSACVRRRRSVAPPRAQLLLEAERVGLIDAAAEGDDGVFHRALRLRAPQRLPADVAAVLHAVEMNLRDAGVGARDRVGEVGAAADDGQHAAAGGDEIAVAPRGAGVKHLRRRAPLRPRRCPRIGWPDSDDSGIAARRERRRRRAGRVRAGTSVCGSAPVGAGDEQRQQRLVDERQDDLRFRIAEPHVELDHLRARRRSASGRRRGSRETDGLRAAIPAITGSTISRMIARLERGVEQRARRERAHPAGVRPAVVVEDALVILRRCRSAARARRRRSRRTRPRDRSDTLRSPARRRRRRTAARSSPRRSRPRRRRDPRRSRRLCRRPGRRPSARPGSRTRRERTTASASSSESQVRKRAVGTPWRAMNAFANALLDSSRAAAWRRTEQQPAVARRNRSATPRLSGSSGPTMVRSICSRSASASSASGSARSTGAVRASAAIPGLPGAHRRSRRRRARRPAGRPARARARRCREPELSLM